MLSFNDVNRLSTKSRGINLSNLTFEMVSIFSDISQSKGLFVPIHDDDLGKAIENGAIAALWKSQKTLPSYTPNHFPVFFVEEPTKVLLQICEDYMRKLKQKEWEIMTKFAFYSPGLLNSLPYTYDIAVEEDRIKLIDTIKKYWDSSRRG